MAASDKPKKRRAAPEIDEAARSRVETELRNALSGREPEFASAVLARLVGQKSTVERRSVDQWFEIAARSLLETNAIEERVQSAGDLAQVILALLAINPWWTRTALVQALALLRPSGEGDPSDSPLGKALAEVLQKWPVLVRTNSFSRSEELSLFEPLATRLRGTLNNVLAVGRSKGESKSAVGLGRTLLSLALFPGLVAQRRPRVTRSGELHGADATKLERALGESRGLFATWERLGAFEEIDGALAPVANRVRRLLDDPGGLVRELLEQRLGEVGFALAKLAASAESGEVLELGSSLLAVGLSAKFAFGFDVPSLTARVERDDFPYAPLLVVDVDQDTLGIPPDVRAAIRGEPLALGAAANGFVQPNYEVVLPPGVPLGAAFVVGCACEVIHFEAVARLRLSRESVLAARSVGIDFTEIVEALEQVSAPRPLPPAVKHAIEEWGDSVGEARIRTAVIFDVRAGGGLLEKVAEKLAPLTVDRPSPQLFVLSRAPNPRELAHLRALGVVTRTVAATAAKHDAGEDHVPVPEAPPWPLAPRKTGARPLRRDLDPHRVMALVEASRPVKKGAAASGPSSSRSLDPDEGAERPLAPAIEAALEERRESWAARHDWLALLRQLVVSSTFRRASATHPGPVVLAIKRAGDPQRLQLEIARIVAEASMRRAAD
ncbi:MAG: helicase-associated domain-containing protein [Polyangiales bacterium]